MRPSRPHKRHFEGNQFEQKEQGDASESPGQSASAKKLFSASSDEISKTCRKRVYWRLGEVFGRPYAKCEREFQLYRLAFGS